MGSDKKLADGIQLGELAKQVNSNLLNLENALGDIPCLVFNTLEEKEAVVRGNNHMSHLFKLSETDLITELPGDYIYSGYLDPGSIVTPLWKSDRNALTGSVMVGRSSTCDIRVNSNRVSKIHAWIKKKEQNGITEWFIIDNYSTNGTKINGVSLEAAREYRLRDGHEINLGVVNCVFLTINSLEHLCSLISTDLADSNETRLTLKPVAPR